MAEEHFEAAMQRLEDIVQRLEGGELLLEESLQAFEEGMKLVKFCSQKLEEVEKKVTVLVEEGGGTRTQVPFSLEETQHEQ